MFNNPALLPVVQCPGLILFPTQVPGIFLSEHQPQLPPVEGADVRLSTLVDALGAYVQDALELHQGQLMDQAVRQHCLQNQQAGLQEAVPLGKGTFGKCLGYVWQQYTCTAVTVPVREAENCLSAIPVTHPSLGYMNFQKRSVVVCVKGVWWCVQKECGGVCVRPVLVRSLKLSTHSTSCKNGWVTIHLLLQHFQG